MSSSLLRRPAASFAWLPLLAFCLAFPEANADPVELAHWTLTDKLSNNASVSADSDALSTSLATAAIARGSAATSSGASAQGYGMKNLADSTLTAGQYIEVAFVVADGWEVAPYQLSYKFTSTKTSGPTKIQWRYVIDSAAETALSEETSITANSSQTSKTLDLSPLGSIASGSMVALRIYAWGASADSGTFVLKDPLSLTGTYAAAGGGDEPGAGPAVSGASDVSVYAGEPVSVPLTISGDEGADVSTNLYKMVGGVATPIAESGLAGAYGIADGALTLAPAKADEGAHDMRVILAAGGAAATNDFTMTVLVRTPSVAPSGDSVTAYVGNPATVDFSFADDVGALATNCVCDTAGVSAESWSYADGVLTYTPAAADVEIGAVSFTVSLTGTDNCGDAVSAGATVSVTVEEPLETLVTWNINANAAASPAYGVTYASPSPITSAALALGGENTADSTANTYRRKGYSKNVTTYEDAISSNAYIEVSFTTAANYSVRPKLLTYNIRRAKSCVTNAQWTVFSNGIYTKIGDELAFDATTEYFYEMTLDLSSLGTVEGGATITLRLFAWSLTGASSTAFGFNKDSVVLEGVAERVQGVIVPPSIDAIEDQIVFVGETNRVAVSFSGDMEYASNSNLVAVADGVAGDSGIDGAEAIYAPADGDADLAQPLEFKIEMTVSLPDEGQPYTTNATYHITVLRKPALEIANGQIARENFDSMGTSATAALPPAWAFAGTAKLYNNADIYDKTANTITLAYDVFSTNTAFSAGLGGTITSAGYYNFGNGVSGEATDRAPGVYSTSSTSTGLRTAALMVPLKNTGAASIGKLRVSWFVEKYKSGRGKTVELRISRDGESWQATGISKTTEDDTDSTGAIVNEVYGKTEGEVFPDPEPMKGTIVLDEPLAAGGTLYLGWFCYATSGDTHGKVQALAIDDVEIKAGNPETTVLMMR